MRKAGSPPPVGLVDSPAVSSVTGLGAGGGAGVYAPLGSGWGEILLTVGKNPAAAGSVVLKFPTAPTLVFAAGDQFGPLTVTGNGTSTITVAWTAATLVPGARERIDYEWSVSK